MKFSRVVHAEYYLGVRQRERRERGRGEGVAMAKIFRFCVRRPKGDFLAKNHDLCSCRESGRGEGVERERGK